MNFYRARGLRRAALSAVFGVAAVVSAGGGLVSILDATQEPDIIVSQRWGDKRVRDPHTNRWTTVETNITQTRTSDDAWLKYGLGVVLLAGAAGAAFYSANRAESAGRNFDAARRIEEEQAYRARQRVSSSGEGGVPRASAE